MKTVDLQLFREELQRLRKELIENRRTETDETVKGDSCDIAATERERQLGLSLQERERNKIPLIHETLERIEDGTYGLCEDCGEEIPLGRLKIRLFATRCVPCKVEQENGGRTASSEGGLLSADIDVREFREDSE
jgi:DnaK suppressor protein